MEGPIGFGGPEHDEEQAPWLAGDRPAWDRAVRQWLEGVAQANGLGRVLGLTEIKARSWSMVARVSFERTTAYFKACGRGGRHEPELLGYLQGELAGHTPTVLAADAARCWMLLADAGEPLRDAMSMGGQVGVLKRLLPRYGAMQLASSGSTGRLLAMGLPDRRLARLPGLLEDLLASCAPGVPGSRAAQLREAVLRRMPALERCCRALGGSEYAAGLDHGDLHTGNVLVKGDSSRIADWGDASVTHPFCSLGVLLETALAEVAESERGRTAAVLVAAYLEPWQRMVPRATLIQEIQAAVWMAHVLRALDFAHMCRAKDGALDGSWQTLIEDSLAAWVELALPPLAEAG